MYEKEIKGKTMKLELTDLKIKAEEIRLDTIKSLYLAGSGHPGGSLSMVEIMTALYFRIMNVDEKNPKMENRDRFVLSKGHAAPSYYAALAHRGFFPIETLSTLRKYGSILQGHPDSKKVPGVDISTGSLGQGISAACGMAQGMKSLNIDGKVYCVLGDGECQEGQVWEAFMSAAHYKLDNLIVILDNNDLQIDGNVSDIMSIYPMKEKLEAFQFHVTEIDGNSMEEVVEALEKAGKNTGKPSFILAKTTKGKGVSFMEHECGWHGVAMNEEQSKIAISDIEKRLETAKNGGN